MLKGYMRNHSTVLKSYLFSYKKLFELHKLYPSLLRSPEHSSRKKSWLLTVKAFHIHPLRTVLFFIIIATSSIYAVEPLSVQDQYSAVIRSYEEKEWKQLSKDCVLIISQFPDSPFAQDATYFLGVSYFEMEDFDMANYQFTDYLTGQATPKYFEEAIQHKFEIAEKFRLGARKHLMGFKSMPKWSPAGNEAILIYDEVISALPHHDLSAHALYGKAQIQVKNEDFRASIETYQTLIRRFSKHSLAVESYIGVGEVYLKQSQSEYPDPDYLDLARLNLRKFQDNFPREEKVAVALENLGKMENHYAHSLYLTAQFYERMKKWGAAKIYYAKILKSYPNSEIVYESQKRLTHVEQKLTQLEQKK